MFMNICSITVIYGEHFRFVQSLIQALHHEGIQHIVVVNNCCDLPNCISQDQNISTSFSKKSTYFIIGFLTLIQVNGHILMSDSFPFLNKIID